MKRLAIILALAALLASCSAPQVATTEIETEEKAMTLKIGGEAVAVEWENNESVRALAALCPLEIEMRMYGGFEQVGSIGERIARSDEETVTSPGDIVLYSGNQIVIFYGSNEWAYTRLGHITGKTAAELTELLGNGGVKITLE